MKLSVDDFQERIRWQKKFKVSMYKLQEAVTFEVGDIIWCVALSVHLSASKADLCGA